MSPPDWLYEEAEEAEEKAKARDENQPVNAPGEYPTEYGGDAEAEGVLATSDIFDLYPEGDIGRMRIDTFLRSGPILWAHNGEMLPVGRATGLTLAETDEGKEWKVGWKWARNAFAQEVRREWEDGIINAMSVGLGVGFDADFDIEDAALREASIVPVGADEGAIAASVEGPPEFLEQLRAAAGADLTGLRVPRMLELAAALRSDIQREEAEMPHMPRKRRRAARKGEGPPWKDEEAAEDDESKMAAEDDREEAAEDEKKDAATDPDRSDDIDVSAAEDDKEEAAEDEEKMDGAEDPEMPKARAALEASARGLVPDDFNVRKASDNAIMRAALAWEHGDKRANAMSPGKLADEYQKLVERRSAALAGIAKANETSDAAAQKWAEANEEPLHGATGGAARGTTHKAFGKMVRRKTARWKQGLGNRA